MNIDEFNRLIGDARKSLVIDFWAPWCAPCRMMNPILEKLGEKYQGIVSVVRVNSDESQELIQSLGVMSIPTLIGYKNGKAVSALIGVRSAAEVERLFARLTGEPPPRQEISITSRMLRAGLGLALVAVGVFAGPVYWLIGSGGLILFSAVYDRCPIYRAVAPRLIRSIKQLYSQPEKNL